MKTLTMTGKDFAEAIKFVASAINKRDPRKVLHFVHIRRIDDDTVRLETTDGKRLATHNIPATGTADKLFLPPDFAKAIIAAKADTVTLSLSDDGELSSDPQVIPAFQMIEGDYPHIDMVTPKSFDLQATFDIKAMKDAINLCKAAVKAADYESEEMPFESEKRILLHVTADSIRIGSLVPGTPSVGIPAKATADEAHRGAAQLPQTVVFNHRFLANTLTGLKGKTALMKWNKPSTPACFFSATDPVLGKLRLLMPIKLSPETASALHSDLTERGLIAA